MGNLSFHSVHKNGTYTDHLGVSYVADKYTDVTVHYETGSFAGGAFDAAATSQHGME